MKKSWYVVKVLPGKERSLSEQFNKDIEQGRIKDIIRFICPTEKNLIVVRNKKVLREKVLYSGYLYFESDRELTNDDLKVIAAFPNLMGMRGDRTPILLKETDVRRILKDDTLDTHIESKKLKYKVGDNVNIIEGPFNTFNGVISELIGDNKVDVEVKIFGRNTIVSLTLSQIEKP
jgi:transcriptional antiterminator NusG